MAVVCPFLPSCRPKKDVIRPRDVLASSGMESDVKLRVTTIVIAILSVFVGCSSKSSTSSPAAALPPGIDTAGMDKSVAPGDDFFAYANGGWIKATPIPADKSEYGVATILVDRTRKQTVEIIQDPVNGGPNATPDARKVGDFYASYMDEAGIESKRLTPLKPRLDAIAAIQDKRALARAIGETLRADVDPLNATNFQTEHLLGVFVAQGLNDPEHNVPYLLQGGLGMPDRDYYVSSSPKMAALRAEYKRHVTAILTLAGFNGAPARAARIVDLETKIAKAHATRVESANVTLAQPWQRDALATKAPGIDWPALLEAAGLNDASTFIVWHPSAVKGLSALVAKEPLDAWKDWLALHTVNEVTGVLPKAF